MPTNKINVPVRMSEDLWIAADNALKRRRSSFQQYLHAKLEELVNPAVKSARISEKSDAIIPTELYTGTKPDNLEVQKLKSMLGAILASSHARARDAISRNIEAFFELVCQSTDTGMSDVELQNRIDAAVKAARATLADAGPGAGVGDTAPRTTRADKERGGHPGKGSPLKAG